LSLGGRDVAGVAGVERAVQSYKKKKNYKNLWQFS